MVDSARITDDQGTIAITIGGVEWHGLTPSSRFWSRYEDWLADGNEPVAYIAPPPDPPERDLYTEIDALKAEVETLKQGGP